MSNTVNIQYTIPSELLGGKKVQVQDHGPFYFWSPAVPVHRHSYHDSVPTIEPCKVAVCVDWVERLPEIQCAPGMIVERFLERDPAGNVQQVGACVIPAHDVRATLLDMHSDWGLVELTSLAHRDKDEFDLKFFNSVLYPINIEPGLTLPDEIASLVATKGGLEARRVQVENGLKFIGSDAFLKKFGKERQELYSFAGAEAHQAFIRARAYCLREIGASDGEIQLRLAGAEGKVQYDPRDVYFQWLLARRPVNDAQALATPAQPVVVQLPEGFNGGGVSRDDLAAIIQQVTQNAVQLALAQQQGGAKSAVKGRLAKPEASENATESE